MIHTRHINNNNKITNNSITQSAVRTGYLFISGDKTGGQVRQNRLVAECSSKSRLQTIVEIQMTKPGQGIALKGSDWKLMSGRLRQSKDLCISSRKRSWEHDKSSILFHHSKAALFYCWCCLLVFCTHWNIASLRALMCNSFLRMRLCIIASLASNFITCHIHFVHITLQWQKSNIIRKRIIFVTIGAG